MKYTTETVSQILGFIKEGAFAKDAAAAVGISEKTYYQWKRSKGEFSQAIKKAEAERKVGLIASIHKDRSWQSKAWMLERIYRAEYASENTHEINSRIAKLEEAVRGLIDYAAKAN